LQPSSGTGGTSLQRTPPFASSLPSFSVPLGAHACVRGIESSGCGSRGLFRSHHDGCTISDSFRYDPVRLGARKNSGCQQGAGGKLSRLKFGTASSVSTIGPRRGPHRLLDAGLPAVTLVGSGSRAVCHPSVSRTRSIWRDTVRCRAHPTSCTCGPPRASPQTSQAQVGSWNGSTHTTLAHRSMSHHQPPACSSVSATHVYRYANTSGWAPCTSRGKSTTSRKCCGISCGRPNTWKCCGVFRGRKRPSWCQNSPRTIFHMTRCNLSPSNVLLMTPCGR